jgi:hypothetical protein
VNDFVLRPLSMALGFVGTLCFYWVFTRGSRARRRQRAEESPAGRSPEPASKLQGYYVNLLGAEICRKSSVESDDWLDQAGVAVWLELSDGRTMRIVLGYDDAKQLREQVGEAIGPIEKALEEWSE